MKFRVTALTLGLAAAAAFAGAPSNQFTLIKDGKPVGRASYTVSKSKTGYHVNASYQYKLGSSITTDSNADGGKGGAMLQFNEGQFIADYQVDDSGNYLSGYTQNASNQMMTSFQPDKARTTVTINQIQGGIGLGSRSLEMSRPEYMVVPDFDPSAIQVLITAAIAHPHADYNYVLLVPGAGNKPNNQAVPVTIQLTPDAPTGTLDGKPVTLKHFLMNYHAGSADIYTDADGTLMEADMGPLKTNYVRNKFEKAESK